MKNIKWVKEIAIMLLLPIPFLVYLYLKPELPGMLPSHYTIGPDGKWVVDGHSSPLGLVGGMVVSSLLVYGAMSLPLFLPQWTRGRDQQVKYLLPIMFWCKAALMILFCCIPIYEMLSATGRIPAESAAMRGFVITVLVIVIINIFIYQLFSVVYRKMEPKPLPDSYARIIWIGTHLMISLIPLAMIVMPDGARMEKLVPRLIFAFLAVMGNLTYSIKPNGFIGIRTPWTLKNETVWRRTHRLGGVVFFIAGIVGLIASLTLNALQTHILLTIIIFATVGMLTIYSFIIYKNLPHES